MKAQDSITVFSRSVGARSRQGESRLSEREELPSLLRKTLVEQYGFDPVLSPPQEEALMKGVAEKGGVDYLVSAPTNSGKTLIAIFRIFTAALNGGQRSVFVVPLKALAEEKLIEFSEIATRIKTEGGPEIKISITTGDYRLTEDFLGSPPPESGEIVICTPERLEVMLRNPENQDWARAVGTYVLDEFHLLGDRTRGKAMELLVTRILAFCPWSCILSLSATIGGIDQISTWLTHSGRSLELIQSDYRFPRLDQAVIQVVDTEEFILESAGEVAGDPSRSLLVFVGTKDGTRSLAEKIRVRVGESIRVGFFHAGIPALDRKAKALELRQGSCRIMVTTTSLKMGVNFPVTDVIIRDQWLRGRTGTSRLSYGDILQMMGRAGRGELPGRATLLCRTEEESQHYSDLFEKDEVEGLKPQLVKEKPSWRQTREVRGEVDPLNGVVLTEVARQKETRLSLIDDFLKHTYSASAGAIATGDLKPNISFLQRSKLIYPVESAENQWGATKLGRTIVYSGLSPESGAMLAGLLRALINLAEKERETTGLSTDYLRKLTNLDFLFLAVASFEARDGWLSIPTENEIEHIQEYLEALPLEEKPLMNRWRSENSVKHPTRRLLTSLKIPFEAEVPKSAELEFNRVMRTALLLHQHSKGENLGSLAERFTRGRSKIHEGNLESGLKYTTMWVLSCLSQICDPRKCYKLEKLKLRIIDLLNDLAFGSTIGKLLNISGVGRRTVETLLRSGIDSMELLERQTVDSLKNIPLGKKQLKAIVGEVVRRGR